MSELIGRFHPLIVHLPIGILVLGFLMELFSRFKGDKQDAGTNVGTGHALSLRPALSFVLKVAVVSAVVAWFTGWIMPKEGEFDEALVRWHFWSAAGLTVCTVLVYFLYETKNIRLQKYYFPAFCLAMLLLTLTGHYGGSLTHGANHLTAPLTAKKVAKVNDVNTLQIYADVIEPIFKQKCWSCHNESKQKGGLLMTTPEALKKGGDGGAIFVANDAAASVFVQRLHLPLEDEKHMPPEGKVQLTKNEIRLMEWWITQGADFEKTVGEVEKPDQIKEILKSYEEREYTVDTKGLKAIAPEKITKLAKNGITVIPLNEESPLVYVSMSRDTALSNSKLKRLKTIKKNIAEIDLSFSNMNDKWMSHLGAFENLTKIKLQHTQVTSKGLRHLDDLEYLQSLNLYATEIDDKCFDIFGEMEALDALYLWQTKVNPESVKTYAEAHPRVKVNYGVDENTFSDVQLKPPVIMAEKDMFEDTLRVTLGGTFRDVAVYYTLDGTVPDTTSMRYNEPFLIDKTTLVKAITTKEGWQTSGVGDATFVKAGYKIANIRLSRPPHERYQAKGKKTLIDFEKGEIFTDGKWLGYEAEHLTTTLDIGENQAVKGVVVSALEDTNSYIFFPKAIKVATSKDGNSFKSQTDINIPIAKEGHPPETKSFLLNFEETEARYVQVNILGTLKNPKWHPAPGAKNWIFVDEILVN